MRRQTLEVAQKGNSGSEPLGDETNSQKTLFGQCQPKKHGKGHSLFLLTC